MKTKMLLPLFMLMMMGTIANAQQVKQITSTEASKMIKADPKFIVLDVRTAEEFGAGHIKGAINIDIKQADALARIDKLDHKAKYIVHCRTHHRSQTAVDHMAQSGFKNIFQMSDGFSGWSQNGLPQVK
jgi:Rhodanese-related sulfurtransferase